MHGKKYHRMAVFVVVAAYQIGWPGVELALVGCETSTIVTNPTVLPTDLVTRLMSSSWVVDWKIHNREYSTIHEFEFDNLLTILTKPFLLNCFRKCVIQGYLMNVNRLLFYNEWVCQMYAEIKPTFLKRQTFTCLYELERTLNEIQFVWCTL